MVTNKYNDFNPTKAEKGKEIMFVILSQPERRMKANKKCSPIPQKCVSTQSI